MTDVITGDEIWVPLYIQHCQQTQNMAGSKWLETSNLQAQISGQEEGVYHLFQAAGPVALDVLPANRTITGSYYVEKVLSKVVQEISSQCSMTTIHNILLLHDSASSHKTRAVTQYLEGQNDPSLASPNVQSWLCTMQHLALSSLEKLTSWEEGFWCPRPCHSGEFRAENNPQRRIAEACAFLHQCQRRILWGNAIIWGGGGKLCPKLRYFH